MNLREFIAHNKVCPFCDKELVLAFHSKRRQTFKYEDGRLIVIFSLDAIHKGQSDYKVGYSFGLDDNSWYAEFYSKDGVRFHTETPLFLMNRFKELNNNLNKNGYKSGSSNNATYYCFFKYCDDCHKYNYYSNEFELVNKGSIELLLSTEMWNFSSPLDNENSKYVKMINIYETNETQIIYWKGDSSYEKESNFLGRDNRKGLVVPLIPFVSRNETLNRLNTFILFS